jgi:DNA-binding NtrC family response regulator
MADSVLVVDDQTRVRHALAVELGRADFEVIEAADGLEGWDKFCQHQPDLVITDLVMPVGDGQQLLEKITADSNVPVLLYSSCATVRSAVNAIRVGAVDFLSSADSTIEEIVASAKDAIRSRDPNGCAAVLRQKLVGESAAMKRLRERILVVVSLRTPVFVLGEPGTDKDAVVRVLHDLDASREGELCIVDCAQNSDAAAFDSDAAVFLRNVESLTVGVQADWAQVLAQREARMFDLGPRMFASSTRAATSHDRSSMHEELRKRLSPNPLMVPTLQERSGDLPELVVAMVLELAQIAGREVCLSEASKTWLEGRNWPGQEAQLKEVLRRAVAFSPGREIQTKLLEEILSESELSVAQFRNEQGRQERERLIATMHTTGGNIKRTAELLGKSRPAVYRLLKKYQI